MGVGLRTTSKAVEEPPNPKARAPRIYPDIRTSWFDERGVETELSHRATPRLYYFNTVIIDPWNGRTAIRPEGLMAVVPCRPSQVEPYQALPRPAVPAMPCCRGRSAPDRMDHTPPTTKVSNPIEWKSRVLTTGVEIAMMGIVG